MFVSRRTMLRRAAVGFASLALLSVGAQHGVAQGDEKASAPHAQMHQYWRKRRD